MNATDRHAQHHANTPDGVLQLRVVVEVDDFDAAIELFRDRLGMPEAFLVDSGDDAEQVAPPTTTPWRSRNSRLDAPGPIHLTLFQELDTQELDKEAQP